MVTRRHVLQGLGGIALGFSAQGASAESGLLLRASVDTTAGHTRTKQIERYLDAVKSRSGGAIDGQLFHSGQLFRDRDVAKALRQGGIELAAPGTWVLAAFESNLDIFNLPMFFGQSAERVHAVSDGEVGKVIAAQLEKKLDVKVLGRWLDLGAANTYSASKPLASLNDLKGMKIRSPGSAALYQRIKAFDGTSITTAWSDVPLALSQGTFDALISTNESVASSKLWESGLKNALQENEVFSQYIPLVSETFWKKLSPQQQDLLTGTWEEMVGPFRTEMAASQTAAVEEMSKNGVKIIVPTDDDLARTRAFLMKTQDAVAKELKVDPDLVKAAAAVLGQGS